MEHMWGDRKHDVPDPFVLFLPEPVDLEISHLDEKAVKKGMNVGKAGKPVKTHHINNSYEPNWAAKKNPEVTIAVKVATLDDLNSCHIHFSCMDHDTVSSHDAVGSTSIHLGEVYKLYRKGPGNPYILAAPLEMDGLMRGTISCVVNMVVAEEDDLDELDL